MRNPFVDGVNFVLENGDCLTVAEVNNMISLIFKTIKENANPELMTIAKLTFILETAIEKLEGCYIEL